MRFKFFGALLGAAALFGVTGCSSEPAKPTAEEVKQFGGGPPPADYMDAANKATAAAKAKAGAPGTTPP